MYGNTWLPEVSKLIPGIDKITALLAVPLAQIRGENWSGMEDGRIPVNVEGSVAYTPRD